MNKPHTLHIVQYNTGAMNKPHTLHIVQYNTGAMNKPHTLDSVQHNTGVMNETFSRSVTNTVKNNVVLTVKEIITNSELKTGKRGQKTQLTGRSPLIRRKSALECSAVQEEEAEEILTASYMEKRI
jgi:hypothetical protein